MSKQITIMISDDLDKKIRMLQAKKIQTTNQSISYSSVLNDVLRNSLIRQKNK